MPNGGATSDDSSEPHDAPVATGEQERATAAGRRARSGRPGPNGQAVPVAVSWDERARRPVAFVWRRRTYRVERVLETWVLETGWWKDEGHISRSYWRVRAGGRVVDLRYDRLAKAWALERELS